MKISFKTGLIALALAVLCSVLLFSCGGDKIARPLPDNFQVKERLIFKMKNAFDIEAEGVAYGVVSEKLIALTRSFVYTDNSGATVATASMAWLSWGTQIDIVDGGGNRIGTIKEEVFSSLFKTWTTYKIMDAHGKVVAISRKTELFSTTIALENLDGKVIAEVYRGAFNWFGDSWSVSVKERGAVDPRILPFIAAYKTVSDNDRDSGGDTSDKKSAPAKK
jgi:uncharacterized protein YxjI